MRNEKNLNLVAIALMISLISFTSLSGTALADVLGDVVVDGVTRTFDSGDIIHNLKVKNGGQALVTGSTIQNDVTIEGQGSYAKFSSASVGNNITVRNAGAFTVEYSTIDNDLKGDKAGQINLWQTIVGNNLRLQECAGFAGYLSEVGNDLEIKKGNGLVLVHVFQIGGNARILENTGLYNWDYAAIIYSNIGNDLTVSKNKMGSDGYVRVEGNDVGGNLKCTENEPTTIVTGNTVVGNVEVD